MKVTSPFQHVVFLSESLFIQEGRRYKQKINVIGFWPCPALFASTYFLNNQRILRPRSELKRVVYFALYWVRTCHKGSGGQRVKSTADPGSLMSLCLSATSVDSKADAHHLF